MKFRRVLMAAAMLFLAPGAAFAADHYNADPPGHLPTTCKASWLSVAPIAAKDGYTVTQASPALAAALEAHGAPPADIFYVIKVSDDQYTVVAVVGEACIIAATDIDGATFQKLAGLGA
jgi:hypothetical protein